MGNLFDLVAAGIWSWESKPAAQLAIEALGFLAVAISVFVYVSTTMIPLRIAAVLANALFAVYFFEKELYPQGALNLGLMSINAYRLRQMLSLVTAIKEASRDDFDFDWLRPFMKPRHLRSGVTLYAKDDMGAEAYVIMRGSILIPEKGVTLRQGALLGEFAMFAEGNRRSASAVAAEDCDLLAISYSDVMQLCAQNPTFGFYLMRLMFRRMQHNVELAEKNQTAA